MARFALQLTNHINCGRNANLLTVDLSSALCCIGGEVGNVV